MSDKQLTDVSSMTGGGESSDAVVEVNIKTLDSQVFTFEVNKNMSVSEFKEHIASKVGFPVEQQRLIFRGKVLKDNHALSQYHVDNGHTLHLIARQPSETQAPSGASPGEATLNNGQDPNATMGLPPRIGQISHSVVLGTLGPGDQGEGFVPDISRVIGAVLNSIGLGGQNGTGAMGVPQPNMQFSVPVQVSQGNQMDGTPSTTGTQSQSGTHAQSGQAFPQGLHIPIGAGVQIPMGMSTPIPSLNPQISDSLHTLSEFMSRMELALSQDDSPSNESQTNTGDQPPLDLPSNSRGVPTPEALMTVLSHAHRLLDIYIVTALSHVNRRLEEEGSSTDINVRGQIQSVAMELGFVMQHLGALFLELGRTILTLRMGQSPAEAYVNAGPAVYISSSGPNPIMVQPFPLQTSSLFRGPNAPSNPGNHGAVGIGPTPRHVNIHIHTAVGPRGGLNGDATQVEQNYRTGSGSRTRQARNANVVPPPPSFLSSSQTSGPVSGPPAGSDELSAAVADLNSRARNLIASQTSGPVSEPPARSDELSATVAELNLCARNLVASQTGAPSQPPVGFNQNSSMVDDIRSGVMDLGMQTGNQTPSDGQVASSDIQDTTSRSGINNNEANNQLGNLSDTGPRELDSSSLGSNQVAQEQKESLECSHTNKNESSLMESKEVLSSGEAAFNLVPNTECVALPAQGRDKTEHITPIPLGLGLGGLQPKKKSRQPRMQSGDGTPSNASDQNQQSRTTGLQSMQSFTSTTNQSNTSNIDVSSAMTDILHNPAFDGLLSGVSQQTGVGSPNVLRNMLEQFTRNPAMMNTVNQIAQQLDGSDVGNMLSGMGGGQGGGFNLAGMIQQMMPIVSQALGDGPTPSQQQPLSSILPELMPRSNDKESNEDSEIDLHPVLQIIEDQNPPEEIFRSLVTTAARLNNVDSDDLLNELCSEEEGLASEFMDVLRRDLRERLQSDKGPTHFS